MLLLQEGQSTMIQLDVRWTVRAIGNVASAKVSFGQTTRHLQEYDHQCPHRFFKIFRIYLFQIFIVGDDFYFYFIPKKEVFSEADKKNSAKLSSGAGEGFWVQENIISPAAARKIDREIVCVWERERERET